MDHAIGVGLTGEYPSFDHYARLTCRLLRVPTSTVTIVEGHRQIFPGASGLQEPYRSTRQTPISHSYCKYVVADERPLIVSDARRDPRLADNPAIPDLDAIAYAGWPLVDADGRTIGSLCAVDNEPRAWTGDEVDVLKDLAQACSAELQQAGRVVKEGENLARAIFASVNVALAFYDPGGHLVLANDLAERVATAAGFRLDEPPHAGPHVRRADNHTPIAAEEQVIPRALRGELHDHELEWVGAPGDDIAIVTSARPVLRSDGTLWGTLIAGHDVTDLARALDDLEHATKAAQAANEAKTFFLANISHELRTPLTSLLAAREMLEDTGPEPQQTKLLDTMERSGNRLRALIESLLDLTRIDAGAVDMEPVPFDLRAGVAEVVTAVDGAAQARGLALSSEIDTRLPAFVMADSDRLRQVLRILVDNALRFTEEGAVALTVSLDDLGTDDPRLVFAVTDTGPGIHPEHHATVFEPFTQIDPSMTRRHEGSGLGLAICKRLVTGMGGDIWVRSAPEQGSTFTVRLPLRLP